MHCLIRIIRHSGQTLTIDICFFAHLFVLLVLVAEPVEMTVFLEDVFALDRFRWCFIATATDAAAVVVLPFTSLAFYVEGKVVGLGLGLGLLLLVLTGGICCDCLVVNAEVTLREYMGDAIVKWCYSLTVYVRKIVCAVSYC